ncbi:uncharacterized protein F4822DRAFT_433420 [Hypoxylon trugodes]|uniref:uncharacterized protein n=1 Tax=Hypoxylon trugodes TaxID=326681 RepID=UPI00218E3C3F|nr:uncharacterized protein F4822DRAFT_433420 [Hypoxylon trugodes]KAI1384880.1 hypothetical protein F4822DRAFT_433420 [Hypoxylon trugodes]
MGNCFSRCLGRADDFEEPEVDANATSLGKLPGHMPPQPLNDLFQSPLRPAHNPIPSAYPARYSTTAAPTTTQLPTAVRPKASRGLLNATPSGTRWLEHFPSMETLSAIRSTDTPDFGSGNDVQIDIDQLMAIACPLPDYSTGNTDAIASRALAISHREPWGYASTESGGPVGFDITSDQGTPLTPDENTPSTSTTSFVHVMPGPSV